MLVPADALVMQGGFNYTREHPFVLALRDGRSALEHFYRRFQPRTLAEMYHLEPQGYTGESLPPWILPWRIRSAPPGEHGLEIGHGVSFYGPCSEDKITLELKRLTATFDSIRARGYQPTRGHIKGQFLVRGSEWRFFISGGKHRAAALVALGEQAIPVDIKRNSAHVVQSENVLDWPHVSDGSIDRKLALKILDRYFQ